MTHADAQTAPETFDTERLHIRRVTPQDAPRIFARWSTDPEVTKYLVWKPHRSLDDARSHVERSIDAWNAGIRFVWFIEPRGGGELLGSIACTVRSRGVETGYLLARDAWGHGYMVEALEPIVAWWLTQPHIFRVWATCDTENLASARVLEKVGFELEGTLRRWMIHPNVSPEPRDALCYSRVR